MQTTNTKDNLLSRTLNFVSLKFTSCVALLRNTILVVVFLIPVLLILGVILDLALLQTVAIGTKVVNLYLPLAACNLAIGVVLFRNPMYALLSLIGVFLSAVVIYIASGAMFLGLVFLIVYVGAVA